MGESGIGKSEAALDTVNNCTLEFGFSCLLDKELVINRIIFLE